MSKYVLNQSPLLFGSIVCMVLVGCGGGSSESTPTPVNNSPQPTVPTIPTDPTPVNPKTYNVEVDDGTTVNKDNLYIVQNSNDPTSIVLAQEYANKRNIPKEHIISVALPVQKNISASQAQVLTAVLNSVPEAKGFALAWSQPYRVGSNQSITSFVSNGLVPDSNFTGICNTTPSSSYYHSGPYKIVDTQSNSMIKKSNIKPAMLLASYTSINGTAIIDPTQIKPNTNEMDNYLAGIRDTIDKGIKADYQFYKGTAYYLKTTDNARNVRYSDQLRAANTYQSYLNSQYLEQNNLQGKTDILIYQTGLANLDPSEAGTNKYLPGAIADTLTSYSGGLYDSGGQISILSYLKAGATASYGTVREPCNFTSKFPQATVLVPHLLAGDSLIEAYNKSVQAPTEGLFIGEPLARPYSRILATIENGQVYLKNVAGIDGIYNIYYNNKLVASVTLKQGEQNATNIGKILYDEKNHTLKAVLQ